MENGSVAWKSLDTLFSEDPGIETLKHLAAASRCAFLLHFQFHRRVSGRHNLFYLRKGHQLQHVWSLFDPLPSSDITHWCWCRCNKDTTRSVTRTSQKKVFIPHTSAVLLIRIIHSKLGIALRVKKKNSPKMAHSFYVNSERDHPSVQEHLHSSCMTARRAVS